MAPEQMSGGRADERTDIYGVGLLLFEMFTGRRPFHQADLLDSARAMFQGKVPRADDSILHFRITSARSSRGRWRSSPRIGRGTHASCTERSSGQRGLLSDAPTLDETDRALSRGPHLANHTRRLKQHRLALASPSS